MIKEFVERWEANKDKIREFFINKPPESYQDVVETVVANITDEEYGDVSPDPKRIHMIDDGDYQGTLLFVIAEKGYQPDTYYFCKIDYGSCSGCDTLQQVRDDLKGDKQIDAYMQLALHVVQNLKEME